MANRAAGNSKLLSIIACGRNTPSHDDLPYRLTTSINFAALQLSRIGRLHDVEFLIGDCSSDSPLSQTLPLSSEARTFCKFLHIPDPAARSIKPDAAFLPTVTLNACLRRTSTTYSLLSDADSLLPAYSFRALFDLIDGNAPPLDPAKAFFFLNRHFIPWEITQSHPSPEEWEDYISLHSAALPADAYAYGIGRVGIGYLAHRDIWQELQGYDECLENPDWSDLELTLRATQKYPLVNLAGIGIHLFHMEHSPLNPHPDTDSSNIPNQPLIHPQNAANQKDWGLARQEIHPHPPTDTPSLPPFPKIRHPLPDQDTILEEVESNESKEFLKNYFIALHLVRKIEISFNLHEKEDLELLLFLLWYSKKRMPRTAYYYGVSQCHPVGIVAKTCPSIDIFMVHHWDHSKDEDWAFHSRIVSNLNSLKHRGFVQYLSGDPSSALERCAAISHTPLRIDLALIHNFISPENTAQEILKIIPYLETDSLLAVTSDNDSQFKTILASIAHDMEPFRKFIFVESRHAFFIKG